MTVAVLSVRTGTAVCEQIVVELPGTPASASAARRLVADQRAAWALGALCQDMALPVGELVTNAVLHARTPVTVNGESDSGVRRGVGARRELPSAGSAVGPARPGRGHPHRRGPLSDLPEDLRDEALHVGEAGSIAAGRGLHIVDAVADEWGIAKLTAGKDVWFRISRPAGWAPATGCRCDTDQTTNTPGGSPLHVAA